MNTVIPVRSLVSRLRRKPIDLTCSKLSKAELVALAKLGSRRDIAYRDGVFALSEDELATR